MYFIIVVQVWIFLVLTSIQNAGLCCHFVNQLESTKHSEGECASLVNGKGKMTSEPSSLAEHKDNKNLELYY